MLEVGLFGCGELAKAAPLVALVAAARFSCRRRSTASKSSSVSCFAFSFKRRRLRSALRSSRHKRRFSSKAFCCCNFKSAIFLFKPELLRVCSSVELEAPGGPAAAAPAVSPSGAASAAGAAAAGQAAEAPEAIAKHLQMQSFRPGPSLNCCEDDRTKDHGVHLRLPQLSHMPPEPHPEGSRGETASRWAIAFQKSTHSPVAPAKATLEKLGEVRWATPAAA